MQPKIYLTSRYEQLGQTIIAQIFGGIMSKLNSPSAQFLSAFETVELLQRRRFIKLISCMFFFFIPSPSQNNFDIL